MASDEMIGTPAYIPWKTFINTLDALAEHMPNRIDPSALSGSGAMKSQILIAFRFFGFIVDDGKPSPALLAVAVKDENARKTAFRKLFESQYAPLIALNLMKTTPSEFGETLTQVYKISGDTRLKATRFFLNAAEYLGVQVSPLLQRDKTKTIGMPTPSRKRRARQRVEEVDEEEDGGNALNNGGGSSVAAESRSVELKSGGTLRLSATTKFMSLSAADRKFVFDLIDKFEEYEAQGKA